MILRDGRDMMCGRDDWWGEENMNKIHHDIFRAIHEGKWLKIEYRNKEEEITKFWSGIRDLDVL